MKLTEEFIERMIDQMHKEGCGWISRSDCRQIILSIYSAIAWEEILLAD